MLVTQVFIYKIALNFFMLTAVMTIFESNLQFENKFYYRIESELNEHYKLFAIKF